MILERVERVALELRIAEHAAGAVDERHAVAEGEAGDARECRRVRRHLPFRRHEPHFAQELIALPRLELVRHPRAAQGDDEDDEHADHAGGADQQALTELHAPFSR